jgi:uncharacterized protein
MEEIVN